MFNMNHGHPIKMICELHLNLPRRRSTIPSASMQYEEVVAYLRRSEYPAGATKVEKGIIRKRSKKFQLVDGVLRYRDVAKNYLHSWSRSP